MAGVKDAIESGQLNAKLLDICPGFSGEEKENCKMVYTRIVKENGVPFDLNMEDALKKKMTPVVKVTGLGGGSSKVSSHAMVAYYLTNDLQEFIEIQSNKPRASLTDCSFFPNLFYRNSKLL